MSIILWVWGLIPWYVQWGVVIFVLCTSIGGTLSLYQWLKGKIGTWAIPAVAGLIVPLGLWVASFFVGRVKPAVPTDDQYPHPDVRPPARKKRKTIFDAFKR